MPGMFSPSLPVVRAHQRARRNKQHPADSARDHVRQQLRAQHRRGASAAAAAGVRCPARARKSAGRSRCACASGSGMAPSFFSSSRSSSRTNQAQIAGDDEIIVVDACGWHRQQMLADCRGGGGGHGRAHVVGVGYAEVNRACLRLHASRRDTRLRPCPARAAAPRPRPSPSTAPTGGRCVPSSSGKRNCRSAVQKWLLAAQTSLVARFRRRGASRPTARLSAIVEQAPNSPRNGMPRSRQAKHDAASWFRRSPPSRKRAFSGLRFAFSRQRFTAAPNSALSAFSQFFCPSVSSSCTASNKLRKGGRALPSCPRRPQSFPRAADAQGAPSVCPFAPPSFTTPPQATRSAPTMTDEPIP